VKLYTQIEDWVEMLTLKVNNTKKEKRDTRNEKSRKGDE
jgi:hypothetical protein